MYASRVNEPKLALSRTASSVTVADAVRLTTALRVKAPAPPPGIQASTVNDPERVRSMTASRVKTPDRVDRTMASIVRLA